MSSPEQSETPLSVDEIKEKLGNLTARYWNFSGYPEMQADMENQIDRLVGQLPVEVAAELGFGEQPA
jgi:hypothetical protein